MRLQRLHIQGFRNIDDLDLDLSGQNGLSVLIGNNGSGKSNILEAVVAIFANLYSKANRFKIDFKYDIEYLIDDHKVEIKDSGRQCYVNSIEVNAGQLKAYLPNDSTSSSKLISFNNSQLLKANSPIEVTPGCKTTFSTHFHPWNW